MTEYWGYHLILDCRAGNIAKITSRDVIESFIKELVRRIGMKAYGNPTIQHFAEHDILKAGYSLVQLIETSSITGHFVDANGDFYIDIFSCKPYDIKLASEIVEKFFSPTHIRITYLTRQA